MVIHVKVTLKSGAVTRFRAKELERNRSGTSLTWTKTSLGQNLFHIALDEVAAITTRRWFW